MIDVLRAAKASKKAVILSHQNSDVDAVLSSWVVKKILERINSSIEVDVVTSRMSASARVVLERLELLQAVEERESLPQHDLCVLVDVNNPLHLGPLVKDVKHDVPTVIIDHHRLSPNIPEKAIKIIDEEATATAEVVCDVMQSLNLKPSRKEALGLLLGILSDSRRLLIGGVKTCEKVAFLLSEGASLSEASTILYLPLDYSEKIARLKASQRATLYSAGRWIVAVSRVGSYEASAARALVDIGADIAAVCNECKEGSRLCVRASDDFIKATGLHLGGELQKMGVAASGSGGGHAGAACLTSQKRCDEVLEEVLRLLAGRLEYPLKKIEG
ncbi:MAG: DHH family phosphoesterase [Candidatus Nezhaarchaeota archaeon]|nr:DHH family phosphoesterase [Candidatus Nezhaarchaeota archaeon]